MPSHKPPKVDDTQIVVERDVNCNGTYTLSQNASNGHPSVYLRIPENETSITCPYCSRLFVYEGS